MAMNNLDVKKQSENAYGQWCVQWREHAKIHSKYKQKSIEDFLNVGVGKALLLVANGWSFEKEIETIKKYAKYCDIAACDKTLMHLIQNGITPQYCVVADANVSYEKYLEPVKDKLSKTILFQNVCGNPTWTKEGNWADIYFSVNKDVIESEKEFSALSGCHNYMAAGTNVSNAMLINFTRCENQQRNNFFGYDKILLVGYDYSWRWDGKYYAFDDNGRGKHNYMRHMSMEDINGYPCYSSTNLHFSCQWLLEYLKCFNLPVVNCSGEGILTSQFRGVLSRQMQYNYKQEDRAFVKQLLKMRSKLALELQTLDKKLNDMGKDHWQHSMSTM